MEKAVASKIITKNTSSLAIQNDTSCSSYNQMKLLQEAIVTKV